MIWNDDLFYGRIIQKGIERIPHTLFCLLILILKITSTLH